MVGPVSSITPQHTPGPEFGLTERQKEALIERQSAELVQFRNLNADLLAACKAVVRWAKEAEQRKVTMPMWCGLLWSEAIGSVNDAIAKARGLS